MQNGRSQSQIPSEDRGSGAGTVSPPPPGSELTAGDALVDAVEVVGHPILQLGQITAVIRDGHALHSIRAARWATVGVTGGTDHVHVLQPDREPSLTTRPCSWTVVRGEVVLSSAVGAERLQTTSTLGQSIPCGVVASGPRCPASRLGDDATSCALPRRLALGALRSAGLSLVDGSTVRADGPQCADWCGHVCGTFFYRIGGPVSRCSGCASPTVEGRCPLVGRSRAGGPGGGRCRGG